MKQTLKKYFLKNIIFWLILTTFIIAIPIFLWIKYYFVNEAEKKFTSKLSYSLIDIKNFLYTSHEKMLYLSEIFLSQLNNPSSFLDLDKIVKNILSSESSLREISVVFVKGNKLFNEELYNVFDSLGNINITWVKNTQNIVSIDTINIDKNIEYLNEIRTNPLIQAKQLEKKLIQKNIIVTKKIIFPVFDGSVFVGIISYTIDLTKIKNILFKYNLEKNTYLIDENNNIIYFNNEDNFVGGPASFIFKNELKKFEKNIVQKIETIQKLKNFVIFNKNIETNFDKKFSLGIIVPKNEIYTKANLYAFVFSGLVLIILIIGIIIGYRIIDIFSNELQKVLIYAHNTEYGQISITPDKSNFDEIKLIQNSLFEINKRFEELLEIINLIKDEKIEKKLEPKSDKDIIAQKINFTLNEIIVNQNQKKQLANSQKKNEWVNLGLNKIHEIISTQTFNSLDELINSINQQIAIFTDAIVSTIYLAENEKNSLKAISTFGNEKKFAFDKEINFGEGIVGTIALERKQTYYEKIPEDYQFVITGLGNIKPQAILIQPLEYENEFYGIIEIAFLRKLDSYELEFFNKSATEIALAIKNIQNNIARDSLLNALKNQTAKIDEVQKLLEQKKKELNQKEKDITERENIIKTLSDAINNTLLTLEITTKGIILNANEKYLKSSGFTLDEIRGSNILETSKIERMEHEQILKKVSEGNFHEKLHHELSKYGEEKWYISSYNPYYDAQGRVSKILIISIDITEMKKNLDKLQKEVNLLRKQVKILRDKI